MVFSSLPGLYLDPPNWQPQLGTGGDNSHQLTPLVVVPPPPPVQGGGRPGLIRPGSMTDRARLAKLPQPETALKCPRCDSINTKFCYFNNYSLSQPRHFCKTCRRYWTRGGALRNVPVGGGCRRNRRTKGGSSGSKSPAASRDHSNNSTTPVSSNSCCTEFIPHITPHQPPQLPFMPSLHHDYGAGDIGFSFASGSAGADVEVPVVGGGRFIEQWRLQQFQQFPFLAGLEPTAGIYQFENENNVEPLSCIRAATGVGQLGVVKSEENQGGVNLSRNILGMQMQGNDYWGGNINAWTTHDLNGFVPSTTSQLLSRSDENPSF